MTSANPATNLPKQMSDDWVGQNNFKRLVDAVGETKAREIRNVGYKKLLAEIAPDGSVTFKELDANANILDVFNP